MEIQLENINRAAMDFLRTNSGYNKFAFYGAMGSGKTTFITALCKALNAIDLVSSPTFSIVNEYNTRDENVIYHFDFYRIKNPEELYDIGFEEYCRNDAWCFIEWPEKAEELIPENFLKVFIEVNENDSRTIRFWQ
ncbi:MAG: tRNA (adenosine(37)-N6)-threonylcarbamoyltransferase complex ATPase subunit type 1 TsaE [Bacteroidales bacterium]|nr:tRNA (adenosine(37)-N6)-threonylcarbamoyltransferase complex ATPase subunit type 1 TsaE [Bacteroidales bacterium]